MGKGRVSREIAMDSCWSGGMNLIMQTAPPSRPWSELTVLSRFRYVQKIYVYSHYDPTQLQTEISG